MSRQGSNEKRIGQEVAIDPAALPYREDLLVFLRAHQKAGQHLVLPVMFALMGIRSYVVAMFAGIILILACFDLMKMIL